jgi:non-ribosomal peptide synthetase component F
MTLAQHVNGLSRDLRRSRVVCVPELVAAQGVTNPDATALADGSGTVSYRDLDARASRLAERLRALGVGTDVPVGLCLPRSVELVVGALAILRAGGAYVPMDPAYPANRLAFVLEDTRAPVVLTSREVAGRLPAVRSRRLCVEELDGAASVAPAGFAATDPADLAYIIYTSGSTGRPKGVEITHGGLANLVAWHRAEFTVTAADRASHLAGLGFDAAVWELWPYLAAGASVHLVDEDTRNSAEGLRDWLLAHRITIGFVPTPLLEHLLDLAWPADRRRHAAPVPAAGPAVPAGEQLRTDGVQRGGHLGLRGPRRDAHDGTADRPGHQRHQGPPARRSAAAGGRR